MPKSYVLETHPAYLFSCNGSCKLRELPIKEYQDHFPVPFVGSTGFRTLPCMIEVLNRILICKNISSVNHLKFQKFSK